MFPSGPYLTYCDGADVDHPPTGAGEAGTGGAGEQDGGDVGVVVDLPCLGYIGDSTIGAGGHRRVLAAGVLEPLGKVILITDLAVDLETIRSHGASLVGTPPAKRLVTEWSPAEVVA